MENGYVEKDIEFLSLRVAGCVCEHPLFGYRPGGVVRCRLCKIEGKKLTVMELLNDMSRWFWSSDIELRRNKIAKLALIVLEEALQRINEIECSN